MEFLKKNIILVGMTGVGKTTIGKILSKEIGRDFYDIDREIEKITNLKIKDFFKMYGEEEFRRLEKSTLFKFLNDKKKFVISPGAGIFSDDEIKKTLLRDSICVFLNAKISLLIARLKKNLANRPKLSEGVLEESLKNMYTDRIESYKKSHITINVNRISISVTVDKVTKALIKYGKTL